MPSLPGEQPGARWRAPARGRLTVLAGGVGAARFLRGLLRAVDPSRTTIVVNTGDDDRFFGLAISPDLDTITYTLAGVAHPRRGWGLRADTFACLGALGRFYDAGWFHLGDRDLATHLYRSERLAAGRSLTAVTAEITRAFGVSARVLPMTDARVRTRIATAHGTLSLQDYLVRRRGRPAVRGVRYAGARRARPAPGVLRAIRDAAAVVIAPSNPFLSIGPILALPGIRAALAARRGPVAAVSPIVGGRPVSGPLGRLLRAADLPVSPVGVAAAYRPFLDLLLIDRRDRRHAPALGALGCRAVMADALFPTATRAAAAARTLLASLGA